MEQVVKYDITDVSLEKLREKYAVVPDVESKEGYETVRLGLAEIRTLRTSVEKRRKELKADAISYGKRVDGEAGRITGILQAIEEPMRIAKSNFDEAKEAEKQAKIQAEQERVAGIKAKITAIRTIPLDYADATSEEIEKASAQLIKDFSMEHEGFDEYAEEATVAKGEVLQTLSILMSKSIAREKEDERLKKEQAKLDAERLKLERERKAQEEKQRHAEAEAAALRKIEQDKLDADRAEFDKQREAARRAEAILEANKAKEAVEKERVAAEKLAEKERIKQEKSDKKLQEKKKSETLEVMLDPLYRDDMGSLLDAIIAGNIPHVTYD